MHIESEQHKNKASPKRELSEKQLKAINKNLKMQIAKKVSTAQKKKNRNKTAKAAFLSYHSRENGRSYDLVRCECGEEVDIFRWRGCKRCPNCEKVIYTHMSFSFALGEDDNEAD